MGQRLMKYYEWVKQEGGLTMQMRLAMKTSYPSEKAKTVPDSPDLLAKFQAAAKEITGKTPPNF